MKGWIHEWHSAYWHLNWRSRSEVSSLNNRQRGRSLLIRLKQKNKILTFVNVKVSVFVKGKKNKTKGAFSSLLWDLKLGQKTFWYRAQNSSRVWMGNRADASSLLEREPKYMKSETLTELWLHPGRLTWPLTPLVQKHRKFLILTAVT